MIFVVGGSGGLSPNSAVIHVTTGVGSTISFAKGGVVAKVLGPEKSHVNADNNTLADWYYPVSSSNYGTWTVTATLGANSTSATVTVNSNKEYDIDLRGKHVLFNCDMYTANELKDKIRFIYNLDGSLTVLGERFRFYAYYGNTPYGWQWKEPINASLYNYLVFVGYKENARNAYFGLDNNLAVSTATSIGGIAKESITSQNIESELILDISNITSSTCYFGLNYVGETWIDIKEVYLTKYL